MINKEKEGIASALKYRNIISSFLTLSGPGYEKHVKTGGHISQILFFLVGFINLVWNLMIIFRCYDQNFDKKLKKTQKYRFSSKTLEHSASKDTKILFQ